MKTIASIAALLILMLADAKAQMTLVSSLPGGANYDIQVVNLSRSGKKIATVRYQNTNGPDTIFFYNLDYSYWKSIPCPYVHGHTGVFQFRSGLSYVAYCSETLFNTDTFLEAAVIYIDSTGGPNNKELIINENGTIVDSITNVSIANGANFRVHDMGSNHFQATISTNAGPKVYNLPGTIPCDLCGGGLGIASVENQKEILSTPMPNPSKDQVKITFTLPEGVNSRNLVIYNNLGQRIKSCTVDNRFGFIMLDNTQLPAGMYYYNILVDGAVSATQKMLVIK